MMLNIMRILSMPSISISPENTSVRFTSAHFACSMISQIYFFFADASDRFDYHATIVEIWGGKFEI